MSLIFGWISGILSITSYIPYVRDIYHGKAQPERASWFIWTILVWIQFFSQLAKGATNSLWLSGSQLFGITLIFLLSLTFGYGKMKQSDLIALLVAGCGLVLWYVTREAQLALWVTIGIDLVGVFLTVVKAYHDPRSEPPAMWVMNFGAGFFASFAVGHFDIILLSYPIYTVFLNVAVLLALFLGSRRRARRKVLK